MEINFALIQSDGSAASGYSVTAADGRWLTEGEDYSIQWYREEATVAEGGGETYVDRAIDGATFVSYTKDANSVYQKFSVQLAPDGPHADRGQVPPRRNRQQGGARGVASTRATPSPPPLTAPRS